MNECGGLEEEVDAFFVRQAADDADAWRGTGNGCGCGGLLKGRDIDAVRDEVQPACREADPEQHAAKLFRDDGDGGELTENKAIKDAVCLDLEIGIEPGVAGGDEGDAGAAKGEEGVEVGFVAVGVDDVDPVLADEGTEVGEHAAIELSGARQEVGLEIAGEGFAMELYVTAGGVRKDAEDAVVAVGVEAAGEIEDDGFGTVHPAAADQLEDSHAASASAASVVGSARLTRRQRRA